ANPRPADQTVREYHFSDEKHTTKDNKYKDSGKTQSSGTTATSWQIRLVVASRLSDPVAARSNQMTLRRQLGAGNSRNMSRNRNSRGPVRSSRAALHAVAIQPLPNSRKPTPQTCAWTLRDSSGSTTTG